MHFRLPFDCWYLHFTFAFAYLALDVAEQYVATAGGIYYIVDSSAPASTMLETSQAPLFGRKIDLRFSQHRGTRLDAPWLLSRLFAPIACSLSLSEHTPPPVLLKCPVPRSCFGA